MPDQSKNAEIWKSLYAQGKNDLKYPNDVLIRIGSHLFDRKPESRLLDFGFGTGANLLHFARQGFIVSGVEISEHAVALTKSRIVEAGLTYEKLICVQPNEVLPLEDNYFDIIIAWQVLYYNDWNSINFVVDEIDRVLKRGGLFVCATAAPGDISHKMSTPLGDCVYKSKIPGQEGCVLLIPEEDKLPNMFPGRKIQTGYFGYQFSTIEARHWIITYRKE